MEEIILTYEKVKRTVGMWLQTMIASAMKCEHLLKIQLGSSISCDREKNQDRKKNARNTISNKLKERR